MNKISEHILKLFIATLMITVFTACDSESEPELNAGFDIAASANGDNYRLITNTTTGAYSHIEWDLGNGVTLENEESFEAYYPLAGSYTIELNAWENGQKSTSTQTVVIDADDAVVTFDVTTIGDEQWNVRLTNTSDDQTVDYTWTVDGIGSVSNKPTVDLYLGKVGIYTIALTSTHQGVEIRNETTIQITQNDPDYWSVAEEVWADEFDGTALDADAWTHETGQNGWGNNELQNYTDGENSVVSNGTLKIIAKKVGNNQAVGDYTSTRLISKGKTAFTYGRMEIRAKLPDDKGNGIWPAIWMLGENIDDKGWPACGEIDIMEYVSFEPNYVHSAIHTPSSYGDTQNSSGSIYFPNCEEGFHNYGILWDADAISFYLDDMTNVIYTYNPSSKNDDTWPFDKPHFFLLNIAVGGNWGGLHGVDDSIFPATMEVDYVRVYQHNSTLN